MEQILTNGKLADRNFAVIIDEAHTSQTCTAASTLQVTLALRDAKVMEGLTVEELLEKIQTSRVRPKNVSYFAFTATPKPTTGLADDHYSPFRAMPTTSVRSVGCTPKWTRTCPINAFTGCNLSVVGP